MIPAADAWGPFRPDIDPHGVKLKSRSRELPIRSDTHARCACFNRLSNRRTVAQGCGYRGRRHVDRTGSLIAVVSDAVRLGPNAGMEIVREAVAHPHLQHQRGVAIIGIEVSGLVQGLAFMSSCLAFFPQRRASSLRTSSKKEMDDLGDQPTDDVHRDTLGEQRQTRPVVEGNASQRASGIEVLS